MGKVFNFEGPLFTALSRMADLFWLNLLFVVCSIPIVTIGAASTALYYVTLKMAKDEEGYITKSYFKSFRDNFKQATGIWLIFLAVMTVMILDLYIANNGAVTEITGNPVIRNVLLVAVFVMTIVMIMTYTYVFAILAQFDNTVKNTIKNAFLISVRHLPYTVLIIGISAAFFAVIWFFSPPLFILVLIVFSLTAYINSKFFNKIFTLYMPKEETEVSAEEIDGEG